MDAILDVLEIRFDPAVADQVAGRLRAIEDLQRLKQLQSLGSASRGSG